MSRVQEATAQLTERRLAYLHTDRPSLRRSRRGRRSRERRSRVLDHDLHPLRAADAHDGGSVRGGNEQRRAGGWVALAFFDSTDNTTVPSGGEAEIKPDINHFQSCFQFITPFASRCSRKTAAAGRDGAHLHYQWGELPKPTG